MTIDKYQLEDILIEALRKQRAFVRVSDHDVGRVLVDGALDVGDLADVLWERLPFKSAVPER
jgi:hypothetical protein